MYNLYGDGIHDDQPAIQEMLDSGSKEIKLPTPAKNYLITKTLEIPSDCSFSLPRHAVIKLADGANCFMLKNKTVYKPAKRLHPEMYNHKASLGERGAEVAERADFFVNDYSPEEADTTRNITVCGGIWDCNNMGQKPNPQRGNNFDTYGYVGYGMLFYNVKDLTLKEMGENIPALFPAHGHAVGILDIADELDAFVFKIRIVAGQLQCRTVHLTGMNAAPLE